MVRIFAEKATIHVSRDAAWRPGDEGYKNDYLLMDVEDDKQQA